MNYHRHSRLRGNDGVGRLVDLPMTPLILEQALNGKQFGLQNTRHSRAGGNPCTEKIWIPACAGMTGLGFWVRHP